MVLIVIHSLICLFLVIVILLQPGKGDAGVGFGSSSQSIFGSKGAGNFLTKLTSICAVVYLFTSFVLTKQRMGLSNPQSVISDSETAPKSEPAPTPAADPKAAEPAKPEAKK